VPLASAIKSLTLDIRAVLARSQGVTSRRLASAGLDGSILRIESSLTPVSIRGSSVHELSVCQALLAQVTEIAIDRGASAVAQINVEVGPLSGVDPVLLASAFEVVRAGSCAAKATLSITTVVVTISCLSCGAESQTRPNRLLCDICGGYRTRVVGGDELRLRRVELRMPQSRAAATA
jgi:hydrogenase nickel incorporation protein HypA/HybF